MRNKIVLSVSVLLLACISTLTAQKVGTKVNRTTAKVDNTNQTINSANSAITTTGQTAQNVKSTFTSIFGKREKKQPDSATSIFAAGEAVHFNITNVDYSTLKKLEDDIKAVKGVKATVKKFSQGGSTIEVHFKGKSDQIWDALSEPVKNLFDLQDLNDDTITLDMKAK